MEEINVQLNSQQELANAYTMIQEAGLIKRNADGSFTPVDTFEEAQALKTQRIEDVRAANDIQQQMQQ